jgi:hypothetical protein
MDAPQDNSGHHEIKLGAIKLLLYHAYCNNVVSDLIITV